MAVPTSPITRRDHDLLAMPTIESQLPVFFANGRRWTRLNFHCRGCATTLRNEVVRGSVKRPLEGVAVVEAVGVCTACRLCTRFLYRLHNDMRVTGVCDGRWVTWTLRPRALHSRLGLFLKKLVARILFW